MPEIVFRIGDIGLSFISEKVIKDDRFNFALFSSEEEQIDCCIDYRSIDEISFKEAIKAVAFAETESSIQVSDDKRYILLAEEKLLVIKDFSRNSCEIVTCSDVIVEKCGDDTLHFDMEAKVLANLSSLVSQFCVKHDGIILHGAGLVRNGAAYVFFALGEGGKTTLITQNAKHHILTDDQIFLSVSPSGKVQADATPFGRLTDGPALSEIKGFFLIRKSDVHKINRADNLNLFLSWIYDNTNVLQSLPKALKRKAFNLLNTLAFSVPVFELKTNYGHIDWDYLDECVETAEQEIAKSGIPIHKELASSKKSTNTEI